MFGGSIFFFVFNLWEITKLKIFLLLHLGVFSSGVFSVMTYQLFKKLAKTTPFSSPDSSNVSELLFKSENAMYLTVYGVFLLLIVDLIYYIKYLERRNVKQRK